MNLLAIDSSASVFSAAVCSGEKIFSIEKEAVMKQTEFAMDIIGSVMKKASLLPRDLQGVLCTGGPGSFTGLRIGYSIAKSLALCLSIPFVPVPTLDCIAAAIFNHEENKNIIIMPVIQARKNSFFFTFFRGNERFTGVIEDSPLEIYEEIKWINKSLPKKIIITGSASDLLYSLLPEKSGIVSIFNPEGASFAKEALAIAKIKKLMDNDNTAYLYSGPEYFRLTDAEAELALRGKRHELHD